MATTLAGLTAYYSNIMRADFAHIPTAHQTLLTNLSTQVDAGALSLSAAQKAVAKLAIDTTSVANLAYNFFTGATPYDHGLDYLVSPNGLNPNNLNSAYYQSANIENRYINFAVNLGKLGEGQHRFFAAYAPLSLAETTAKAYTEIFGAPADAAKVSGILDAQVPNGVGGTYTRADYFAFYGRDGQNGIGTKAALVGWLMAEAAKADTGSYVQANNAFLADLGPDGFARFHTDLISSYGPQPAPVVVVAKDTAGPSGAYNPTPAGNAAVEIHLDHYTGAPSTGYSTLFGGSDVVDGGYIKVVTVNNYQTAAALNGTLTLHVDSDSTAGLIFGYVQNPDISARYKGPLPNLTIVGPGDLSAQIGANFDYVDATAATGDLKLTYLAEVSEIAQAVGLGSGTNSLKVAFSGTTNNLLTPAQVKFQLGAGADTFVLTANPYDAPAGPSASAGVLSNLHVRGAALDTPPEIVGFQKGVDHLVVDALIHSLRTDVQFSANGKASLTEALAAVSAQVAVNTGAVFTFGGDTYVYAQDGRAGLNMTEANPNGGLLAAGDGLIKLAGVTGLTVGTGPGAFDIHYG